MDDDVDLDLIRAFRIEDAAPPAGLRERIEEELWEVVLAEESRVRSGGRARAPRRHWLSGLMRPAIATGVTAMLAVGIAVMSNGAPVDGTSVRAGESGSANVTTSNVLDATATSLFGSNAAAAASAPPVAATFNATEDDMSGATAPSGRQLPAIAAGPGTTAEESATLAARLPRSPQQLLEQLHSAAGDIADGDASDRVAFRLAMRWIVNPTVPINVRANMLRSLDGLAGIDQALRGADVLGRPGIVVGHIDERTGVREQYVLSAEGGLLLERRAFMAGYVDPACPPGTFTDHALFSDGQQIDPAQVQWVDWPAVVNACDPATR